MRNQAKYRAFLSYGHADVRQAQSLHRFIEGYSIPKRLVGRETNHGIIPKRLRPVFKDRDELPSASDLGSEINKALKSSEHLIVINWPSRGLVGSYATSASVVVALMTKPNGVSPKLC